jgi:hypothetical protein
VEGQEVDNQGRDGALHFWIESPWCDDDEVIIFKEMSQDLLMRGIWSMKIFQGKRSFWITNNSNGKYRYREIIGTA